MVYDGIVNATFMEWFFSKCRPKEAMENYKSLLDKEFEMVPATCNVLLEVLKAEAEELFDSMLDRYTPPVVQDVNSDTFNLMENEIKGLKAQLLAYTPVIGSLKENISSLEHNVSTMANLILSNNRKSENLEVNVHPHNHQSIPELNRSPKSLEPNGISELIEFQTRIAALEKVIVEDINAVCFGKA